MVTIAVEVSGVVVLEDEGIGKVEVEVEEGTRRTWNK
jgi:hypothetical protein